MLLLKILINLVPALCVIVLVYLLFFFDIIPGLIRHYRKASKTSRQYDKDINSIKAKGRKKAAPTKKWLDHEDE